MVALTVIMMEAGGWMDLVVPCAQSLGRPHGLPVGLCGMSSSVHFARDLFRVDAQFRVRCSALQAVSPDHRQFLRGQWSDVIYVVQLDDISETTTAGTCRRFCVASRGIFSVGSRALQW
jgi:hypothetical protein